MVGIIPEIVTIKCTIECLSGEDDRNTEKTYVVLQLVTRSGPLRDSSKVIIGQEASVMFCVECHSSSIFFQVFISLKYNHFNA
jgi:hypothetical protein